MAHFKLTEADDRFIAAPQNATALFTGTSAAETFVERAVDCVVRIEIRAVGVATANGGSLAVAIEIGGETARGEDGPAPIEAQLRASVAVQALVKAGQRLTVKARPEPHDAVVLRTVIWAADLPQAARETEGDRPAPERSAAPANGDGARSTAAP